MKEIPIFGDKNPQLEYIERPGAYGILFQNIQVALIKTRDGALFLPGGGIEKEETPEEGLMREIQEELGREVAERELLGSAYEYSRSAKDNTHYLFHNWFYKIEVTSTKERLSEVDQTICWLDKEEAIKKMFHRSHAWALEMVQDNRKQEKG